MTKLTEFNPDYGCELCAEHIKDHIETAKALQAAQKEIKRMIHTCPVCNGVTCASGSNVEFSKFATFCTCGGVEGLKAEIERLNKELAALKKRVDKPLGA